MTLKQMIMASNVVFSLGIFLVVLSPWWISVPIFCLAGLFLVKANPNREKNQKARDEMIERISLVKGRGISNDRNVWP